MLSIKQLEFLDKLYLCRYNAAEDSNSLKCIKPAHDMDTIFRYYKQNLNKKSYFNYLIKDRKDNVYAYLSLSVGVLYKPFEKKELTVGHEITYIMDKYTKMRSASYKDDNVSFCGQYTFSDSKTENVDNQIPKVNKELPFTQSFLYQYQPINSNNNANYYKMENEEIKHVLEYYNFDINSDVINLSCSYEDYISNENIEVSGNVSLVKSKFLGIEIVSYGINTNIREKWKEEFPNHRMGATLFWHIVRKKLLKIRSKFGVKYVYLFAADKELNSDKKQDVRKELNTKSTDSSEKRFNLLRYYNEELCIVPSILLDDPLFINKTNEQNNCMFCYQEIKKLENIPDKYKNT